MGQNHPNTLSSMNNLANLYRNQGKYAEAEPLYVDCLRLFRQLLGENHPNTLAVKTNLAILLEAKS